MHLKHSTAFNDKKPRANGKKKQAEPAKPTEAAKPFCPKFTFDNHGNLKDVMTKEYGWVSIHAVNKWFLLKVQAALVEQGDGDTPVYKGVYAEIERRIASGEITPKDTTPPTVTTA